MQLEKLRQLVVDTLDDMKARDIQVMDVPLPGLAEVFVVHEDRHMDEFQVGQDL